jgi:hypothetical protein
MQSIFDHLAGLPDHWGFVAVGNDKRPYQPEWQKNPLTKQQVAAELESGRAVAVGVLAGPQSGGLLFVDHDGLGASAVLEQLGIPLGALPKSWAVTSGRDGRFQVIYQVPKPFWPKIKTTKIKSDIKGEQLELRWTGCQSVVLGAHPITGSYRWNKGRSPDQLDLAEAPSELLTPMMRQPEPAPLLRIPDPTTDAQRARDYLTRIPAGHSDDYDDWLKVGMALHSVGDDSLLQDWISWSASSGKFESGICEAKWATFNGTGGVGLGTLHHFAGGSPITTTASTAVVSGLTTRFEKPTRLDGADLMNRLRVEHGDALRWNIFTQSIELHAKPIDKLELFYLRLADEHNIKVAKDLAADCLVRVAHENQYDPVKEHLELVASQVQPANIDHLATRYLRPKDKRGSLYDEMLKRTLIAAVRRIYEPGSKHDHACVLMGPQGCGKSTFWRNLGGHWFSDALRDINSKDDLLVLHRSWIMEWAELDHLTGRRHAGQVKAFLSQQTDTFRVPYGRSTEAFPRRCIIVGSTNRDTGFLVDDTGNRRFWVIPVLTGGNMIDCDDLALQRDAIWSAAVHAYRAGEPNHLSHEQAVAVDQENQSYMVESPWKPAILRWLTQYAASERIITSEVLLTEAIDKPVERQTRSDQMQVGSILKELGYGRTKKRVNGSPQWVYVPTSEE